MSERMRGRRALVTGASGGIGQAIATALVGEGAAVAAVGRQRSSLESLQATLPGGRLHVAPGDVSDAASATESVQRAAAELGGLDTIVNAAAIDSAWKPVAEMPPEAWDETIDTNLSGTFYVCRAGLPFLVEAGGGAIVNVTSVAGIRAWEDDSAYAASKAGVEMLTRQIAVEYGRLGVRANCLAPGVIDAGMTDAVTDPVEREKLVALHPLGRLGTAEEVAEATVWLCSAGSFTTGTTLVVDGGFLARG